MTKAVKGKAMLTIFLGLLFLFAGCGTKPMPTKIENTPTPQDIKTSTSTSKEQAMEVATKTALQNYNSLESFNLVACETARVWVIIYDGGGPAYVISKESGTILGAKKIPEGSDKVDKTVQPITEEKAIHIAEREASILFGNAIDRYDVFTCQLAKTWVVTFEYREVPGELLPNSRSPLYVIDKSVGKVIYREG